MANKFDLNQVGADLLMKLLQSGGQAVGNVGQAVGNQVSQTGQALSQAPSPVSVGSTLMTSSYMKGAQKALAKRGESDVNGAIDADVPVSHIEADLEARYGQGAQQQTAPTNRYSPSEAMQNGVQGVFQPKSFEQPQAPQAPQQQQDSMLQNSKVNPASNFFSLGGVDADGNINSPGVGIALLQTLMPGLIGDRVSDQLVKRSASADLVMKMQKIRGEEPLQPSQQLIADTATSVAKSKALAEYGKTLMGQENKVSDDYNAASKDFSLRANAFSDIQALGQQPSNAVNSLALSYSFIRLNDPNAVKEGELQNLKTAQSWFEKNGYGRVFQGDLLSPKARARLLKTSTVKYNNYAKQQDALTKRFSDKLKAYGGDPERAFVNPGIADSSQSKNGPMKVGRFQVQAV